MKTIHTTTMSMSQTLLLILAVALVAFLVWGQGAVAEEVAVNEAVLVETAPLAVDAQEASSTTDSAFIFADESTSMATNTVPGIIEEPAADSQASDEEVVPEVQLEVVGDALLAIPEVQSEKSDYHPGEIAIVFGRFFAPLKTFVLKVFGSDESNQNYVETIEEVTTDEAGSFSFSYLLDSLYRPFYEVVVSTLSGEKVAETYFRDAAVPIYDQCSNNLGTGYPTGDTGCRWTTGALNGSNSVYQEGDATVQRVGLDGFVPGSSHTITLQYGTTKQGKHAYDFLTSWNHSENWITQSDRCQDITGCTTAPETTFPIPNDTNGSGQFQGTVGSRNFVMRGGTITAVSAPVLSGSYAGDSETEITLTFTVDNSGPMCVTKKVQGNDETTCGAALWFGAHIARTAQWQPFNGTFGATSISGSPYHVALQALDGGSVGQRDNQMQASAIPATLIIRKDTVPNAAQDFSFTTTGTGLTNFTLDDDDDAALSNTKTFILANGGNFTVIEGITSGYALTNLVCTDPTSNTTVNLGTRTATIALAASETVECTFTNTLQAGSITIVKNTLGGNGEFNFTSDIAGNFALNTVNNTANQVFNNVVAGTYSVTETVPAGWVQTSTTCSDGSPVNAINLSAGENITCIFENSKLPTLTINKVVVNDNGGTAVAGDFQGKVDGSNVAWGATQTYTVGAHTASETTLSTYSASAWSGDCAADGGVTLAYGDTKVCSITNDDNAPVLHLRKVVVNDNGGGATVADFTLTANGATTNDISGTSPVDSGNGLKADTFSLSETSLPGYTSSSWVCVGGTQNGASITLGLGQEATCTITNDDQQSYIVVDKTVVNDNGGNAVANDFLLKVDDNAVFDAVAYAVNPGAHKASETLLTGYSAGEWGTDCDADGDVTVAQGETKTCTITNNDNAPKLTLNKILVTDNGGTATEADWILTATGPTPLSGAGAAGSADVVSDAAFDAGVYTLSESAGPTGYTPTGWTCSNGDNDGTITVGLGDDITCSITNNDNVPSLTLVKQVTNDDGGAAVAADWTLSAAGATPIEGAGGASSDATFDAGTYTLSESTGPSGYAAGSWNCIGGTQNGASITLGLGQSATCTIINDDQPGTLVVHKVTNPDTDTTTQFTITAAKDVTGFVEGVAEQTIAGGETETYTVHAGVYDVTESVLGGWDMTDNTCADVAVANGETEHCTITNTKKGHLIVEKVTFPALDATSFAITASGDGVITGGGAGSITDASDKDYEVTPGMYSVTETVPAGWDMTGNTCDDVVVAAGETETCAITNTKRGSITIVKDAINNNAQDFTFNNNFGNSHPATFKLDDDANATLLNTRTFEVLPGTYAVSEDTVAGWQQESATCTDQSPVGAINVEPGENVTCTFVNEEYAKIVLVKNTQGGNGDFDFDATGGNGLPTDIDLTTVDNTASVTFADIDQDGTYAIAENVPEGWTLISSSCSGTNTPEDITPNPGETVTCTFVNGKLPTLTLTKSVVNNYGGTKVAADFQGKINNVNQAWTVAKTLTPGSYTATESSFFGYSASAWGTDCAADGTVSLAYGENKTCSITNSDIAPKLTVIKHVINDNGGNDEADDFTMNVTGTQVSDDAFAGSEAGVTVTLDAGEYGVDEGVHTGYTKTLGANCSGTIAIGEEKTCTITNDDQPASVTLTKEVVSNNGGNAAPDAFGLTIGGKAAISGQSYEVNSNTTHALNEAGLASYAFVSLTGDAKCPAVLGGTVTLNEGEHVSCTITNDDIPAHLIVIKHVDNGNTGGTAEAGDFTTTITGVTTANPSVAGAEAPGIDNILTTVGAYSVDEGSHTGYDKQLSADCTGIIALGDTKTCTITNTAIAPKLTVIKVVDNGNTGATYTAADFQMKVDGANVLQNVAQIETVGEHKVTETGPGGYSAVYSGDCNEDGEVTLALAEEKTCTITNTAIAPKLTLVKTVVNNNGGTKQVADFPLSIDGLGVTSGVANTVTVGTHTASEVGDAGYTASVWGGDCADNGSVTLDLAEEKICMITNDDKPGKIEIIKNTVGGNATFNYTVSGPTASTPSVTTVANTGTTGVFEVNAGAYSALETAKTGWDLTSSSCSVGAPANFTVANGETVTCTFTNTKRATVTIVKDAQPNDVQDFTFTSTALGGFTLDDDAGVTDPASGEELGEWSNTKTFTNVLPGAVSVAETQPNQYWKLKGASCVVTGTSNVVASTLTGNALTLTATPGSDITCTFVNEKLAPTRTQGFWQTHTTFTSDVFTTILASKMKIGTVNPKIDTVGELFGAWYANIAKKTDNKQRTSLDKARMSLLQQLVTAKLNCAKFGCTVTVQAMIDAADAAFAGTSTSAITAATGQLDAYNNSGDTIVVGNTGKATPKTSESTADKAFWNTLP